MTGPKLVVFDLDGTLIDADSAQQWMQYLYEIAWPGTEHPVNACEQIMEDYSKGCMNMRSYMLEWLTPITGRSLAEIIPLAQDFARRKIRPLIFSDGMRQVKAHQRAGDIILLISASPIVVVQPIAELFGINHVIAVDIAIMNNKIQGEALEPFSFQDGKRILLQRWLKENQLQHLPLHTMYTDSLNDLPLLQLALNGIVVNGDKTLKDIAKQRNWLIRVWQ